MAGDPLDWITLAEFKTLTEAGSADTSYDTVAPPVITEASQALNTYLQRQVTPKDDGPTSYDFEIGGFLVDLAPYDLRAEQLVELHPENSSPIVLTLGTGYNKQPTPPEDGVATDIQISRYQVVISDRLFRFGAAALRVTGAWGWAAVPPEFKRACALTVQAWLRQRYTSGYHLEDPREVVQGPVSVGEIPLSALRLVNRARRQVWVA